MFGKETASAWMRRRESFRGEEIRRENHERNARIDWEASDKWARNKSSKILILVDSRFLWYTLSALRYAAAGHG